MSTSSGSGANKGLPDIPDDVSVTSTLDSQHDSEDEFTVERVLAEATDGQGDNWYLIQWTGYPIHRWTWEPQDNLHEPCLAEWKEIEQRQQRGEEEPFDTTIYDDAVKEAEDAKAARHRRRNMRRKMEGIPLNLYEGETAADYYLSDEDVGNDDFNEVFPPPRKSSSQTPPAPPPPVIDLTTRPPPKKRVTEKSPPPRKVSPTKAAKPTQKTQPSTTSAKHEPARTTSAVLPGKPRASAGNEILRKLNPSASKTASTLPGKGRSTAGSDKPVQGKGTSTGLKAKKSSAPAVLTTRSTSGNVFISGKKIRSHAKLGDTMADKTKDPKHFSNFRIGRKAELSSRDKADMAPSDPNSLGLFNISTGAAYNAATNKSPDTPTPTATDGSAPTGRAEQTKSALKKSRDSTTLQEGLEQPPPKKARSVRFTGDDPTADGPGLVTMKIFEDVEMVDEPASLDDDDVHDGFRPPTPPRVTEASNSQAPQHRPRQNLEKHVVLGPSGSKKIAVIFEGLPTGRDLWLSELTNTPVLEITHSCTSQTFLSQSQLLKATIYACGNVISSPGPDACSSSLDLVAESLKLGSFGLARTFESFVILIYPARCEKWAATVPEAGPLSTSGALKYLIVKATDAAGQQLNIPASFTADLKQKPGSTRSRVIRQLLALDYSQLLSPRLQATSSRHVFFLAFPPSREAVSNTIGAWLRDVNPHCRIFSSLIPGDWKAFTDQDCGIVIIHEKALPLIRLLPGLSAKLRLGERYYTFWRLQENMQRDKLPTPRATSSPLELSRLFPHGTIVLLTPSFLVTQPCRARQFFLWFKHRLNRPGSNIHLVLSAGISEFLEEVAQEKARRRQLLFKASRQDARGSEASANDLGLTQDDCNARFELIQIVNDLIGVNMLRLEGSDPLVFSEDCINPSDEQSLVNWFGYWSQAHLDRFRKFFIIGCSVEDAKRATRIMGLPVLEQSSSAKSAKISQQDMGIFTGHETEMLGNDSARAFSEFLFHERFQYRAAPFLKLYSYPVSYFDKSREMADHFGDTHSSFAAIETWLNWAYPFDSRHSFDARRNINTLICLFYTIDGEWDPQKYPESKLPPRRPWIGVYRVKNSARFPWTATELLIWDPRAPEMCPADTQPRPSHLLPAQKAMVQAVQDIGSKKNPPVEDVWFGGFDQPNTAKSTVIDRTLEMLEYMMQQPKAAMPASETLLTAAGYKRVQPRGPRTANDPSSVTAALDADMPVFGKQRTKNIIFHPPRNPDHRAGATECENHFFQQIAAASSSGTTQSLSLNFRPTLEWYGQQKREGRNFEHITVGAWEPIFKALQITTDADAPA